MHHGEGAPDVAHSTGVQQDTPGWAREGLYDDILHVNPNVVTFVIFMFVLFYNCNTKTCYSEGHSWREAQQSELLAIGMA